MKNRIENREKKGKGEKNPTKLQECLKFLEQVYITKRHHFTDMFTIMLQRQMCAEGLV